MNRDKKRYVLLPEDNDDSHSSTYRFIIAHYMSFFVKRACLEFINSIRKAVMAGLFTELFHPVTLLQSNGYS